MKNTLKSMMTLTLIVIVHFSTSANASKDSLAFASKEAEVITSPTVIQEDGRLTIYKVSFKIEKLNIKIFDSEGHLLTCNTVKGDGMIGKRFNTKGLEKGTYTIKTISNKKNHHSQNFEIL